MIERFDFDVVEDYLDKHFPKGEDKRRGEALVLISLAYLSGSKKGMSLNTVKCQGSKDCEHKPVGLFDCGDCLHYLCGIHSNGKMLKRSLAYDPRN